MATRHAISADETFTPLFFSTVAATQKLMIISVSNFEFTDDRSTRRGDVSMTRQPHHSGYSDAVGGG